VQPDPKAVYSVKATDTTGFSISYDVEDESGVEWSVKIGDEAQSEVTASRMLPRSSPTFTGWELPTATARPTCRRSPAACTATM
jgi:hypothetical protein